MSKHYLAPCISSSYKYSQITFQKVRTNDSQHLAIFFIMSPCYFISSVTSVPWIHSCAIPLLPGHDTGVHYSVFLLWISCLQNSEIWKVHLQSHSSLFSMHFHHLFPTPVPLRSSVAPAFPRPFCLMKEKVTSRFMLKC